jgi:outer membrane protein TolC
MENNRVSTIDCICPKCACLMLVSIGVNMKYKINFFLLIVGMSMPVRSYAEIFSPEQVIDLALKNSILINAHQLEVKSKEMASVQASSWDNPTFEIGTEYKKEPIGDTKFTRYGLSQTLYRPGKFSTKQKVFQGEADIAKQDLISTELNIRGVVFNLIFELKAAKEKLSRTKERVERFRTVENYLKSRVFAAPQKKAEASIVVAKLIVLQKELLSLQAQKENLWNELNSYLKIKSEPEINLSWYRNGPLISLQELSDVLIGSNPDLQKQNARLAQSKSEMELSKIESWPSLTLSGSYSNGSGLSPEKIYGLGVSLPLPTFNTNSSGRAASEFKYRAEDERYNYLKEQMTKQLRTAFLAFEFSKKSIGVLPLKKIVEFEKATQEIDKGFKRGQVDLLTYLEADTQHFESLSAILEAQLDLAKSISELQMLTGRVQLLFEK